MIRIQFLFEIFSFLYAAPVWKNQGAFLASASEFHRPFDAGVSLPNIDPAPQSQELVSNINGLSLFNLAPVPKTEKDVANMEDFSLLNRAPVSKSPFEVTSNGDGFSIQSNEQGPINNINQHSIIFPSPVSESQGNELINADGDFIKNISAVPVSQREGFDITPPATLYETPILESKGGGSNFDRPSVLYGAPVSEFTRPGTQSRSPNQQIAQSFESRNPKNNRPKGQSGFPHQQTAPILESSNPNINRPRGSYVTTNSFGQTLVKLTSDDALKMIEYGLKKYRERKAKENQLIQQGVFVKPGTAESVHAQHNSGRPGSVSSQAVDTALVRQYQLKYLTMMFNLSINQIRRGIRTEIIL